MSSGKLHPPEFCPRSSFTIEAENALFISKGEFMLLIQRIEETAWKSTGSSRAIGEFLLHERYSLHEYSMQEIADRTFTSKSTLVRFAKSLGYSGWKEFLEALLPEIHQEKSHFAATDVNYPFHEDSPVSEIIPSIATLMTESILETMDLLDQSELEKAVRLIQKSHDVLILAQSPNIYEAMLFQRKMLTIKKNVMVCSHDMGLTSAAMGKDSCVIMISYSGNNPERYPLKCLNTLIEDEVPVIAITGLGDSILRSKADCVLSLSSRERLYSKTGTFSTEESIAFILNVLYACYFSLNYAQNLSNKIELSQNYERRFSTYIDIRED